MVYQTLLFQRSQSFPYRSSADPELGGEFPLHQPVPGRIPAFKQGPAQVLVNPVPHLIGAFRPGSRVVLVFNHALHPRFLRTNTYKMVYHFVNSSAAGRTMQVVY